MSFFVMPYRVLFHDTMAYGTHHFLTNFKFQNVAREHMFFEHVAEASSAGRKDHEQHIFLTQQAYMRSLAPVSVGQRVAVLVSAEEQSPSSVRLCFRIVRDDGVPVSCGFQTMVCVSRATGEVAVGPASIRRGEELMVERLSAPSFAERVLSGRLRGVFDEEVLAVAREVVLAPPERSYPRFLAQELPGRAPAPDLGRGVVFVFAGQGSYSQKILTGLLRDFHEGRDLLARAEQLCRERLGSSLAALVESSTEEEHAARLARSPELSQVAVYLTSVLAAHSLMANGVRPDAVMGHSAGEIAALAVAGSCSLEDGLSAMVERARALRAAVGVGGGMLAVFVSPERTLGLLKALALPSLDVAVVNHDEQAVVSGLAVDLDSLARAARALDITTSRVPSPFAFHSRQLAPAVGPFREALRGVRFGPARVPVYSPMEGAFTPPDRIDLPSHFVRRLDFAEALRQVQAAGGRAFVECGARVLGTFVKKVLAGHPEVEVFSPYDAGRDVRETLAASLEKLSARGLRVEAPPVAAAAPVAPAPPVAPPPAPAPAAAAAPLEAPAVRTSPRTPRPVRPSPPIAVVSLGSVLPGSVGPEGFWRQILAGTSGLSDAAERQPVLADYFLKRGGVTPDKTYTFLGGYVLDPGPGKERLSYSPEDTRRLTLAQSLLATAFGQCLDGLPGGRPDLARTMVLIGATADGVREYDEALLATSLAGAAEGLSGSEDERAALAHALEEIVGRTRGDLPRVSPFASYSQVVHRILGGPARLVTVDAACASSLYSVILGVEALRDRECDLVLAGGVFAPGPASSCLFSQFQGLSARHSRPFDAAADGVVFGEGSAFLALRRLSDALDAKEEVLAVVRGFGLSSDGKSPSVAVPKKQGQTLAMHRAYASTGIDPATVQYVEAHATSTPVGDSVEFSALSEVFPRPAAGERRVELGSVKGLIGHTGWTAGTASLVKMTMALRARTVPPQTAYESSLPAIDVAQSPFAISTAPSPWPANRNGEPRRAAVSGFGFGGTNAHVILEEFDREYHTARREAVALPETPSAMVVVASCGLFPFERGVQRFDPERDAALPEGIRVLPDVAEDMDVRQRLAVRMASQVLQGVGGWWTEARDGIGVVLGFDGKTERAIEVNQRIYLDLVSARLREGDPGRAALGEELIARVRAIKSSGPYTLPGIMPNVVTGRAANLLNLHGPNLVVGGGDMSLLEALRAARQVLIGGDCDMVLAGAMSGCAGAVGEVEVSARPARQGRPYAEGALMLAVMREETARERGLRPLAEVRFGSEGGDAARVEVGGQGPYLGSAEGCLELRAALQAAQSGVATVVAWPGVGAETTVRLVPVGDAARAATEATVAVAPPVPVAAPATSGRPVRTVVPGIRGPETQVVACTPVLVPVPFPGPGPHPPKAERLLLLVDQDTALASLGADSAWAGRVRAVACPANRPVAGALPIDLSSEAAVSASLDALQLDEFDAVVAVKDAGGLAPLDALGAEYEPGGGGLLHVLFAVARRVYERVAAGQVAVGTVVLRGLEGDLTHACSGLLGGFTKSLAREIPSAFVKSIITDAADVDSGLGALDAEWAVGPRLGAVEVVARRGAREEFRLRRMDGLSTPGEGWLGPDSVVVATGGGRGVTAVLLEEVLRRFGPTLVVVGRSDLTQHPPELLALSEEEFRQQEPEYYRAELLRDPSQRMADLKRRLQVCRGARELREGLDRLRGLGGRVEYATLDVNDPGAVDALVGETVSRHGRLDLVVHGAALQSSRGVARKALDEFTRVGAAKVMGAVNFARACERHRPGQVRHHVLTSAFSHFGNDGQCDYGAANEALGRLCAQMGAGRWTSMGWLGWAAIGMTRGSEYAELARSRGVKAITAAEGQALFGSLLEGEPRAAENVLITEGEVAWYGVPEELLGLGGAPGAPAVARGPARSTFRLDLVSFPYLRHHLVRDHPTVPGTFESELAARTAKQLRPDCHVVEMHDSQLPRFARLDHRDTLELRGVAEVVEERGTDTMARVQLLSDFVHKSGRILQKDVLHFETLVRLAPGLDGLPAPDGVPRHGGLSVPDPYLSPGAPVRLDGFFRCLRDIEISEAGRVAHVRFDDAAYLPLLADFLTPALLLDALFRFSMIHLDSTGTMMPVYVPVRCGRTLLLPGINDVTLHAAGEALTLLAPAPRVTPEGGVSPWARVEDSRGRTVLYVEDLQAVRVGQVPLGD
jgi:acyl transferase domain-containing protein/acyl-CoA thioesterase FadM